MARTSVVVLLMAVAFMACGWDWTVVPKTAGGDAGEAGISADASCASNAECRTSVGEYCVFADGLCGAGQRGVCKFSPPPEEPCEAPPFATCGCDGKAGNECAMRKAGIDLARNGACPAPDGTFRCGPFFCPQSTYCYESRSKDGTSFFDCGEFDCAERNCACNPVPKCTKAICTEDAGSVTVLCPE